MIDSCRLRKLDPGLEAMYSMAVALMTSTIKSDPGLLMILSLGCAASFVSPSVGALCAAAFVAAIWVPMTAAALTAAPFKKERRSIPCLLMICLLIYSWTPMGYSHGG